VRDMNDSKFSVFLRAPLPEATALPPAAQPGIEPSKGTSRLCWAARIVCLLPWIAAPLLGLAAEATHGFMYETRSPFNFVLATLGFFVCYLIFPGFLLTIPTLIAWKRHLLGGMLLVLSSGLFIGWICAPVYHFGQEITPGMTFFLAVPVLFLIGGLLHLAAWLTEPVTSLQEERRRRCRS